MTDDETARDLVDGAFRELAEEEYAYAQRSFEEAADAYKVGDLTASARALDGYASEKGSYGLCVVGAQAVAGLLTPEACGCGQDDCSGGALDVNGDPEPAEGVALCMVTLAEGQHYSELATGLQVAAALMGPNVLHELSVMFVTMHASVRVQLESK